jgi:hypothetical protein
VKIHSRYERKESGKKKSVLLSGAISNRMGRGERERERERERKKERERK